MKLCNYCAKEIDYNHQYCCDDCEKKAQTFFIKERRAEKLTSIINVIAFFGVIIGGLCGVIFSAREGFITCGTMALILGVFYLIFPFAPENIKKKYKLQRSIKIIRIVAVGLIVVSAVLFIVGIFII